MTLTQNPQKTDTDLFIIGAGMAGMAAAVFAANRGIKTVISGAAGGFEYASGLLDLWGLSLTQKKKITKKTLGYDRPFAGTRATPPLCEAG